MARRLATEYVKASLQLAETQLTRFVQSIAKQSIMYRVKVLENGKQEVVLEDGQGDEIVFLFEKLGDRYVCETSCRLVHLKLTKVMHKLVATFRGQAVANRIFPGFTITYYYTDGLVRKIVEHKDGARVVFEHKDTVACLHNFYHNDSVEMRIVAIRARINKLLDRRNQCLRMGEVQCIDSELTTLAQQLFILEG